VVNTIAGIHTVIFHHHMHRSNYLVHRISSTFGIFRFYEGNPPRVVNTSHRSGADTLFAIVQVQYEEHASHIDAIELNKSSLYSTADMR
jgi:hypothetical protein